jgi:predicted ATPase
MNEGAISFGPFSLLAERRLLLRQSLVLAQERGALSWELRTATSLARLMKQQGRTSEARERLEAVYLKFTEGFTTKDLVEARSLLTSLHASSRAM